MPAAQRMLRVLVPAGVAIALIAPATAAQAAPSATEIQQQINTASRQLEKIVEQYDKANEELKASKASSNALAAKMGPLDRQVTQARAGVDQLAATAFMKGQVDAVNALLGAGSTDAFLNRLSTLDQLARSRQETVAGFTAVQQRYRSQKLTLDVMLAQQTAQARQLAERKSQITKNLKKLYAMRRQAYGSATSSGSAYTGSIPAVSGKAGVAVRYAYGAIGKPYVWAADGPNGYDCSGLTLAAWRAAGVTLPHNAAMQWGVVAHISRSQLQPGDLVFYENLGHVALYVGSGKVIHAPTFGEVVQIASVDMMTPYGYGRVRA